MIYIGGAALDQVRAAQQEITLHLADMFGRCLTCAVPAPCPPAARAERTMQRYGILPRRRPGSTQRRPWEAP